jgi:hypothetical protein
MKPSDWLTDEQRLTVRVLRALAKEQAEMVSGILEAMAAENVGHLLRATKAKKPRRRAVKKRRR